MNHEEWQHVITLFDAALERAPQERAAFVAASEVNEAVRERVRHLLLTHEAAADFLKTPAAVSLGATDAADANVEGRHVGPYRLVREIGRGGMATIYLAVRDDDTFHREVALKLVWPGLDGREMVKRFRRERQILADLDHYSAFRIPTPLFRRPQQHHAQGAQQAGARTLRLRCRFQ